MGGSLSPVGQERIALEEVRETKMADECRHDRRNARQTYATEGLGLRIRDVRQRFLPTEHGPVALPLETRATYEYQAESSSKRPTSSVILVSRKLEETQWALVLLTDA